MASQTKPKCPTSYACSRCSRDKKNPKNFSIDNFTIPSAVPAELQNLTQIEEMLIARALPIMKVFINAGGQRGYKGHCVNLPQKVEELALVLPHSPKNVAFIFVKVKGNSYLKDVTVRKNKVEKALYWLIKHNPVYHDVHVDRSVLKGLPSHGVPEDLRKIETVSDALNNDDDEQSVLDKTIDVKPINESANSLLSVSINDQLEHEVIKKSLDTLIMNWPSLGDKPLNENSTPFLATMAFPLLFPDSKGDPTNPSLLYELSFNSKVQHLIKFAEKNGNKWVY